MDILKDINESIDQIWCLNCGMTSFTKSGFTKDKRQRIKCKYCNTKTTIGAKRKGERLFDENKLLPILRKNPLSLSKAEKYCMGLIIADGCFTQGHTFSYSCAEKDKEIILNIKQILGIGNPIGEYSRKSNKNKKELMLRWRYKYSKEYWAQLGLNANKTGNEVWLGYMEDSHFIRGYFEGDGCIFSNGKEVRLSFTSLSKDFLTKLSNYLHSVLGIKKQEPYFIHEKRINALGLRYRRKETLLICDYLYEDSKGLRLERKYQKYLEIKKALY